MTKLSYTGLSIKGKKAKKNEDYLITPLSIENSKLTEKGHFFVLCDGIGGHNSGEIASKLCSEYFFRDYFETEIDEEISGWLKKEIKNLNKTLKQKSREKAKYNGMGTTLVNLLIKDDNAYINNVGDSRLYIYTDHLRQITEDHSPVWKFFKMGIITKDEILKNRIKNVLSQGIGLGTEVEINSYKIPLPKKFIFLLCSDGLTDVTIDSEIENLFSKTTNLQQCVEDLYDLSQKNGSRDDVSLILVSNYQD